MKIINKRILGLILGALGGVWKFYSNATTIRDLADDAGWVAKMFADPPNYLPYLVMAFGIVLIGWTL